MAHGGHCVARHEGRVIFVRHALPGELVRARIDPGGEGDRFWRAEVVEVLRASPDRVPPPCPLSGPGGCGGCDWQHVALPVQRRLKGAVVAEQLRRLGGVEVGEVTVEPVPGDEGGLGWRTRLRFAVDEAGRPGLRRHRSHEVVPVSECPIAHPRAVALGIGGRSWTGTRTVEVAVGATEPHAGAPGEGDDRVGRLVVVEPAGPPDRPGRVEVPPLGAPAAVARRGADGLHRMRGRTWLTETVRIEGRARPFRVTGTGFWQVHPGAAQVLLDAVLAAVAARPGEHALDLYAGAGLFTAGLAAAVGPTGRVTSVESDQRACADARRNLHDLPMVRLEQGVAHRVLARAAGTGGGAGSGTGARGRVAGAGSQEGTGGIRADVVVLDPPRGGAGRRVVELLAALRPRTIGYVACDPAALARDVATAAAHGYRLESVRAFDAFPMTHHVECLAVLRPAGGRGGTV